MSYITETFEHAGLTVKIGMEEYDTEHANPRDNDGNLGTMFCWHPHYKLGDEQFTRDHFDSMEAVAQHLVFMRDAVAIIPLYLYDHSGISMTAGTPNPFDNPRVSSDHHGNGLGWDTTMVGYIYTTKERIEELCGAPREGDEFYCPTDWKGTPREWINQALANEVTYYNAYLMGQVYWWAVEDEEGDTLASCGMYLCATKEDGDYLRTEATGAAEWEANHRVERAQQVRQGWAMAHVIERDECESDA